jgi:hypothetical protein
MIFFVPERQLAIAGMFNLEGIPGPERIALGEAIADVMLGEAKPNPDHSALQNEPRHRCPCTEAEGAALELTAVLGFRVASQQCGASQVARGPT